MTDTTQTPKKGQDFESALDKSDKNVAAFERKSKGMVDGLQHLLHLNPTLVPVMVLVASVLIFSLPMVTDGKFMTMFNLSLVMQQVSIIGILAAAQSLIILTAGIDL
ncbi:MAG: ABC transporter permease, partial [Rhodobacterales bacterium]